MKNINYIYVYCIAFGQFYLFLESDGPGFKWCTMTLLWFYYVYCNLFLSLLKFQTSAGGTRGTALDPSLTNLDRSQQRAGSWNDHSVPPTLLRVSIYGNAHQQAWWTQRPTIGDKCQWGDERPTNCDEVCTNSYIDDYILVKIALITADLDYHREPIKNILTHVFSGPQFQEILLLFRR